MDPVAKQILREYSEVLDELIDRELLVDSTALIPFESREGTMLSWADGAHLSYLFGDHSVIEHYRAILDQRDFCLCFIDGGLIQIQYEITDRAITRHRLSFFPCPFVFLPDETQGISLSDLPLLFSADELRSRIRLSSPIRFDFDSEIEDDRHARSHVTFNKASCRLPAYGPISLGHFCRFVLRYFYEKEFVDLDDWEDVRPRFYGRTLPYQSPHEFHLETAIAYQSPRGS